jgi:hypothetical protein
MRRSHGDPRAAFIVSPFTRVARTHVLYAAGDALIAIALAKSVLFSADPDAARWRVALYLLLTMAPFAVVAPLLGPAIDRMAGGRRMMILASGVLRAIAGAAMVTHLDSLVFFPLAFTQLVSSKAYAVAVKAVVPGVVSGEDALVEANSKLGLITGLAGVAAAIPGGILYALDAPAAIVALATVVFVAGTVAGVRIPAVSVASAPAGAAERAELRSAGIVLAASAIAVLRGIVGFLTFLVVFTFRRDDVSTLWLGVVLAFATAGGVAGNVTAPLLRRTKREETMLALALGLVATVGVLCGLAGGTLAAALLGSAVGAGANTAKLAFDSIVQRDAPDANKGRSLASFETRFQLAWVIGAFVPVLIPIPGWAGYLTVGLLAGFALASYLVGMRAVYRGGPMPTPLWVQIRQRVRTRPTGSAGSPFPPPGQQPVAKPPPNIPPPPKLPRSARSRRP